MVSSSLFERLVTELLEGKSHPFKIKDHVNAVFLYLDDQALAQFQKPFKAFDMIKTIFSYEPYTFYEKKRFVLLPERAVFLTEKETELLSYLLYHPGASRQKITQDIFGYSEGTDTHTLETHIYRLRQKLELSPAEPVFLINDETSYRINGLSVG